MRLWWCSLKRPNAIGYLSQFGACVVEGAERQDTLAALSEMGLDEGADRIVLFPFETESHPETVRWPRYKVLTLEEWQAITPIKVKMNGA